MNMKRFGLGVLLCLPLSGCGEQGWIWEVAMRKPAVITPLRDYWVKPGMTEEGRTADWVTCGGGSDGQIHVPEEYPNGSVSAKEMLAIGEMQRKEIYGCMKSRGYQRKPAEAP